VDVAFVVSPDLSHAFIASLVARAMRVRLILVVQDIMPDAAIEMGMLSNRGVIFVSKWFAKTVYSLAGRIFTLSEGMKRRIERYPEALSKTEVVPNTIDDKELEPRPGQGREFRSRYVPKGGLSVLHTGNMGAKQDLQLLLRTARRLIDRPNIHFYVFGDGAAKEDFLRTRDEWKLTNVSHFPLQERSFLPHMLYGADICLVSQLPEVLDVVVPSKLITAMGAGAMIFAACSPGSETAMLIRDSEGGILIPASDDGAFASAVLGVSHGAVNVGEHRKRARDFALKHFSREAVYGPVVTMIREMCKRSS